MRIFLFWGGLDYREKVLCGLFLCGRLHVHGDKPVTRDTLLVLRGPLLVPVGSSAWGLLRQCLAAVKLSHRESLPAHSLDNM